MLMQRMLVGKLNTDDSEYTLAKGDYPLAENISVAQKDGTVYPIVSNRLVNYTLPAGTNNVIGAKADEVRNRVIYFVYNSTGKHSILIYNNVTRTVTKLLESVTDSGGTDILRFNLHKKIVHIDIIHRDSSEGDILSWTVSGVPPRELIIDKFLSGAYGATILEEYIEAAKRPPLSSPTVSYQNDASRVVNGLRRALFQFRYRWVYDDYSKSTWSPISKLAVPTGVWANPDIENDPTKNNYINVDVATGSKRVVKIEIAGMQSTGVTMGDLFLITSIDKADLAIADNAQYTYSFYNDGLYPYVDQVEADLLFDWVPKEANAQALANGNVKVYGAIKEGYNRLPNSQLNIAVSAEVVDNDTGSAVITSPSLTYTATSSTSGYFTVGSGVITGTRYLIIWQYPPSPGNIASGTFIDYTSVGGDNPNTIAAAMAAQRSSYAYSSADKIFVSFPSTSYVIVYYMAQPPASPATQGYEQIWNWGSKYRIGVAYFDEQGRTNGVHIDLTGNINSDISTPNYSLSAATGVGQTAQFMVEIGHQAPSWAKKYQLVRSRNLVKSNFVFWRCSDVQVQNGFYYFNIDDLYTKRAELANYVPNYEYADGDRLRVVISNVGVSQTVPNADYLALGVVTKNFGGAGDKKYVKVKQPSTSPPVYSGLTLIELWSPANSGGNAEDEIYYEFGEEYDIVQSGGNYYHKGNERDQTASLTAKIRIKNGDVYYRKRKFADTDSYTLFISDAHFSDNYKSAVNGNGRPEALDYNARETYFPTLVRFGGEYQAGTSINQLNRFYFDNLDEYDRQFGDIMKLVMRDRMMRVFQKLKVGSVPVYQQVIKDAVGGDVLAQSDRLLNKIQYYVGDWGVGDNPESVVSSKRADYYCDTVHGVVCRVSLDGVNPLSIQHNTNDYFTKYLTKRGTSYHVYGGFHNGLEDEYIISMEATGSDAARTITFDESSNGFETFYTWHPEMMTCLGQLLITFKNGAIWTHDDSTYCNIFGVQHKPKVKLVFNDSSTIKKNFIAVATTSGETWYCESIETSLGQDSNLIAADFRKREDGFHATLLRDTNTGTVTTGDTLKGNWISVSFTPTNGALDNRFIGASIKFNISNQNNR